MQVGGMHIIYLNGFEDLLVPVDIPHDICNVHVSIKRMEDVSKFIYLKKRCL